MKRSWGYALIAALVWASSISGANAAPPPLLPIQGYLTNSASAPLDGTHQIRFRLYDADMAGTTLFEETLDVNVADGFFTIYLGDTVALDLALFRDNPDVYLGIKVGTDAEASPRLQLGTTAFASLASFCGDADTIGGLAPEDFQSRVVGTCSSGQFMQTIADDGSVTCASPASETDPTIASLTAGRLCATNGSTITCDQVEGDPQVATLTAGRWCTTDGTTISCTTNPPVTVETDPQVGTLVNTGWCTSDGSAVNCNQSAPLLSESDPQVGALTASYVPRWDGTALTNGRIFDNNVNVGINNTSPNEELDVGGDVEVTGEYKYQVAKPHYTFFGPAAFDPAQASSAQYWVKNVANGYGHIDDSDATMPGAGSSLQVTDLALPNGATVTEVLCSYYDNATDGGLGYTIASFGFTVSTAFNMYRRPTASVTTEIMAGNSVTTTAAAASTNISSWSDNTITNPVINNGGYDYYLSLAWNVSNDQTAELRFYGCRVAYSITQIAMP